MRIRIPEAKRVALAKRLADASEKMGVGGMALGAFQGNMAGAVVGGIIFIYSLIMTWRIAK